MLLDDTEGRGKLFNSSDQYKAKSYKNSKDSEELQNKQKSKIVESTEMGSYNLNYRTKVRLERITEQSNETTTNGRNCERA